MMNLEIYGTLGPSCCTQEMIEKLLKAGMSGMRLNLSHCNLADRKDWIDAFHQACRKTGIVADLMIDMRGPELRTLDIPSIPLQPEQMITLDVCSIPSSIIERAEIHDVLLIDDGRIQLQVLDIINSTLHCTVQHGEELKARKSIMIQGKPISGPLFTESDINNLKIAREYGVTSIMQPFVSSKEDLIKVREMLKTLQLDDLKLYAKIENMTGVHHIEEMMHQCECIVIARGDLGNACGLAQLPHIQKQIERQCHLHNQKYMVVTEMLNSMIHHPVPTRAEVSDIYHAVYHGADAIMLTGETANGNYPLQAMKIFTEVALSALKDKEREKNYD